MRVLGLYWSVMKVRLVQMLLAGVALAIVVAGAVGAPMLPERDPLAPFRRPTTARGTVIRYFEASRNNDSLIAASLIDYDEWAKSRDLEGAEAEAWAAEHRAELAAGYAKDRAEGIDKAFRITKETYEGTRAIFEVEQARGDVTNLWQVSLVDKGGCWSMAGFRLLRITR